MDLPVGEHRGSAERSPQRKQNMRIATENSAENRQRSELSADGRAGDGTPGRAIDYLALADGVLYAIRTKA